ncbi:hypothetical protein CDB3_19440 [Bacillus sp. CDB3]|nr:hypothetical protein CDB3_19440 [Bacillus sp. CDB3]
MDVTFILFFVGETLHIHQSKSESKLSLRKDNAFFIFEGIKINFKECMRYVFRSDNYESL